jgi:HK97 family phage portal protein
MGIFDRIIKRADEPTSENTSADDALLSALLSGDVIDTQKALTVPAVQSAVGRISTLVAILPIKLYKRVPIDAEGNEVELKEDGTPKTKDAVIVRYKKVELPNDKRVFLLNTDSGDTLDQFAIKRNIARDYLVDKGGFLYIMKKGNSTEVEELRYIPPTTITAVINDVNPMNKDGQYLVLGKHYNQWEFISVLRDTDDGFLGKPLTKQINDVLATAVANILYENGIVRKGGTKKGFLVAEKELTQPAMDKLKKAWRDLYSNTSDNMMVLNKGLTFQEANDNSVDLQIDQRKKTLFKELSEVFGIHSDKFEDIFRDAVLPVLEAIESALNKSFLLEAEKATHFFQFDKREVVKASLKERYESYKVASEIGVLTKNEIRDSENLEPIDGMDVVSMGLGDVIFDVKTKEYFTPNTGATKTFDDDENADDKDKKEDEA